MIKDIEKYMEKYSNISDDIGMRILSIIKKMRRSDLKKLKGLISLIKSITWSKIYLTFYMEPKATSRPRNNRFTKVFYVKNASFNSKLFKKYIDGQDEIKDIIITPTIIKADFFLPIPDNASNVFKLLSELRLVRPICKPDLDNTIKTYMDMIQTHLLVDDSLVIELHVRKFYSLKPRIEMQIEYMDSFDCKENENRVKTWKNYKDISS